MLLGRHTQAPRWLHSRLDHHAATAEAFRSSREIMDKAPYLLQILLDLHPDGRTCRSHIWPAIEAYESGRAHERHHAQAERTAEQERVARNRAKALRLRQRLHEAVASAAVRRIAGSLHRARKQERRTPLPRMD